MNQPVIVCDMRYNKLCDLVDNEGTGAKAVTESISINNIPQLSFTIPLNNTKIPYIINENLILFNGEYYRIKTPTINHNDSNASSMTVNCAHLSETLQTNVITMKEVTPKTAVELMKVALLYTGSTPTLGWAVGTVGVSSTIKRGLEASEQSSFSTLCTIAEKYDGILKFNSQTRTVDLVPRIETARPDFELSVDKNLKGISITYDTSSMLTKMYGFGGDDSNGNEINFMSVNSGKAYVENYQYFIGLGYNQTDFNARPELFVKTGIFRDSNYYDKNDLLTDTIEALDKKSKPVIEVKIEALDLSKYPQYAMVDLDLGDAINIRDEDLGIVFICNLISKTKNYDEPHILNIEVTNQIDYKSVLSNLFQKVSTGAQVVSSGAVVKGRTVDAINTNQVRDLDIKYASIEYLDAHYADIEYLAATYATIHELEANYATIDRLVSDYITADEIEAEFLRVQDAVIQYAKIVDLDAARANIVILNTDVGNIKNLVNGNLTSENILSLNLTSLNTTIQNGMIKNAMIESLNVDKINAGTISTNKFDIQSNSGNLVIADNTIQISDTEQVRVQIGKDASGDYNMYVFDASGKLMFDATGIHEDAIKSAIIRNDMVSDTANISAHKLNINTLFEVINNDNTHTIKGSKIYLDSETQTLDILFNTITTDIDNITDDLETKTTQLNIVQGKIGTIISETQIEELEDEGVTFYDKHSSLEQTVSGFSSKISEVESSISQLQNVTFGLYTLSIESLDGMFFDEDTTQIRLKCTVFYNNEDITDTIKDSFFIWTRKSLNSASDNIWNAQNKTGKMITLVQSDLEKSSSFSINATVPEFLYIRVGISSLLLTNSGDKILVTI